MKKVRIKTAPQTRGSQDQFALVDNLTPYYGNLGAESDKVNESYTALKGEDLKKAKIEVEGGESVIGDVNRDGHIDLFHFKGKRHSEGGMPVDIPEGSFIYSDTQKLKIKDKEVLEKFFGLPFRKGGYTPAEISKKYSINKYVQLLKDEDSDAIAKRTANEMIKKNTEKLGILAFIQEAMKGFPDGVPEIAMIAMQTIGADMNALMQASAPPEMMAPQPPMMNPEDVPMEAMQQAPMEEQMMGVPAEGMMRYGGLAQYEDGGKMQSGKIYTFKDRPGNYYKIVNGKVHIKNKNTDGKYVLMQDPEGTRRKTLESGLSSGKTTVYKKPGISEENAWKYSYGRFTKTFDDKEEYTDFINAGDKQRNAYLQYTEALKSNDPAKMVKVAKILDNTDIANSVGWWAGSDQDKLDEMAETLREKANRVMFSDFKGKVSNMNYSTQVESIKEENWKKIKTLPAESSERAKLVKENEELDASLKILRGDLQTKLGDVKGSGIDLEPITTRETLFGKDVGRKTSNDYTYGLINKYGSAANFITKTYDKKFNTNVSKEYDLTPHILDSDDIEKRATQFSQNKGYAPSSYDASSGLPQGVFKMKANDEYGKARQKFEYKIMKDADGKDAWFYQNPNDPSMSTFQKLGTKESIDKLNRDYGKNLGYPTSTSPQVTVPETDNATVPTTVTPSTGRTTTSVRSPQPSTNQSSVDAAFDGLNFKYGGAYKSVYQFKYGGKPMNLKSYDEAGKVKGNPDEEFVQDGELNGVKVKYYRKTLTSGKVVNIARNAETGSLMFAKDPSTGNVTNYDEAKGFSYTYDKNKKLLDSETRPYAGEGWKAEGWKGKYDESAVEFEKLLKNNTDLQDAVYDNYMKVLDNPQLLGKRMSKDEVARLKAMPKNQVIELLIRGNNDNLRMKSVFSDRPDALGAEIWDKKLPANTLYKNLTEQLGIDAMEPSEMGVFQAAYLASTRVAKDPNYIEKFQKAGFDVNPTGLSDQVDPVSGLPISPIDEIYGNTTNRQTWYLKDKPPVTPDTPPPADPTMKSAYFCVQSEDGSKNVVSVQYKEGETPAAPAGAVSSGYSTQADADAICAPDKDIVPAPQLGDSGPWYTPDYTNFLTAASQRIGNFPPNLRLLSGLGIGYDTLNPMTITSSILSAKAQRDALAQQTVDPTTAMALSYGDPEVGAQLGAGIGDIELKNIGITGQAYGQRAELDKFLAATNLGQREKYDIASATYGQQSINSLNKKDALKTLMFNTGWHNWSKRKGLEQVLYPQVRQNPILADWAFSGKGRDFTNPFQTYSNPMGSRSGSSGDYESYRKQAQIEADAAYNDNLKYSEGEASKAAIAAYNRRMGLLTSASGKGRTNNPAAAAVAASPYGMGVPQYGAMPYSAFDDDSI
jgi:hypothetical protein